MGELAWYGSLGLLTLASARWGRWGLVPWLVLVLLCAAAAPLIPAGQFSRLDALLRVLPFAGLVVALEWRTGPSLPARLVAAGAAVTAVAVRPTLETVFWLPALSTVAMSIAVFVAFATRAREAVRPPTATDWSLLGFAALDAGSQIALATQGVRASELLWAGVNGATVALALLLAVLHVLLRGRA
ncbi:MAG: hypothetical protein AAGH15_11015 [Myxococcota bacterium]